MLQTAVNCGRGPHEEPGQVTLTKAKHSLSEDSYMGAVRLSVLSECSHMGPRISSKLRKINQPISKALLR